MGIGMAVGVGMGTGVVGSPIGKDTQLAGPLRDGCAFGTTPIRMGTLVVEPLQGWVQLWLFPLRMDTPQVGSL